MRLNILLIGFLLGIAAAFFFSFVSGFTRTPEMLIPPTGQTAIRVALDEAYLNSQLQANLEQRPGYEDPIFDLQPPNLAVLTISTSVANLVTVRPTVTLQFGVQDNSILIEVLGVNIGELNIPRPLVEQDLQRLTQEMEAEVNQSLGQMLVETGLELVDVRATESGLVLDLGNPENE